MQCHASNSFLIFHHHICSVVLNFYTVIDEKSFENLTFLRSRICVEKLSHFSMCNTFRLITQIYPDILLPIYVQTFFLSFSNKKDD